MTTMTGSGLVLPDTFTARWRPLYDALRDVEYGTSFTYAELSRMAGLGKGESIRENQHRWLVLRTRKEMLRHDRRFLANLRTVGYRIVHPEEHLKAGNAYRAKSMRAAGWSERTLGATDLALITDPDVRAAITNLQGRMARMRQALRHQEARLVATEIATAELTEHSEAHEERIASLEEKLRRVLGDDVE